MRVMREKYGRIYCYMGDAGEKFKCEGDLHICPLKVKKKSYAYIILFKAAHEFWRER